MKTIDVIVTLKIITRYQSVDWNMV